jgi:hypothetical protein
VVPRDRAWYCEDSPKIMCLALFGQIAAVRRSYSQSGAEGAFPPIPRSGAPVVGSAPGDRRLDGDMDYKTVSKAIERFQKKLDGDRALSLITQHAKMTLASQSAKDAALKIS